MYSMGNRSLKGDAMTEEEARKIMQLYGWVWHKRKRRNGILYIYAIRRRPKTKKFQERYIAPLSKLPELTEQDIVVKLTSRTEDSTRQE